jgi:hypothetical protein
MNLVVGIVVVVVIAVVLGLILRGRSQHDGVDSFRRQIDALSPDARRPTVDRVKSAERPLDPDAVSTDEAGANDAEVNNDEDL